MSLKSYRIYKIETKQEMNSEKTSQKGELHAQSFFLTDYIYAISLLLCVSLAGHSLEWPFENNTLLAHSLLLHRTLKCVC